MASRSEWRQVLVSASMFFGILTLLVVLGAQFDSPPESVIRPIYVVVALIPIVLYLVATKQLQRLGGAGFEVQFREQALKTVSFGTISDILNYPAEITIPNETDDPASTSIKPLEVAFPDDPPTALTLEIGRPKFYDPSIIEDYISRLAVFPKFQYLVFTDADRTFQGFMTVEEFNNQYYTPDQELTGLDALGLDDLKQDVLPDVETFVAELGSGEILDRAFVNLAFTTVRSSNKDALDQMNDYQVSELAVVDTNQEFVGVVTENEIVREILSAVLEKISQ